MPCHWHAGVNAGVNPFAAPNKAGAGPEFEAAVAAGVEEAGRSHGGVATAAAADGSWS